MSLDSNETIVFASRDLVGLRSIGAGIEIANIELRRCRLRNCVLATTDDPATRARVRDVVLDRCVVQGASLLGVVIQDTLVEDTQVNALFLPQGCAFVRVTLRGRIGRMLLGSQLTSVSENTARRFDEANAELYAATDWALDITHVEAEELEIRNIPVGLIRRDPERHIVFIRSRLRNESWRELDLKGTGLRVWLDDLLRYGPEAGVFVVPDIHPKRQRIGDAILALRSLGIAESN